eukprot:3813440-Amphidinium_carterae.1
MPASSSDSVWMRDLLAVDEPGRVPALDTPQLHEDEGTQVDDIQHGQEGAEGEEVEAAWEALEELREQTVMAEEANIDKFYRVSILGGEWSVRRSGRVVNSFRTDIRHDTYIHACATRFGLPISATFDVELYTHEGAAALSELWKARMHMLAEQWRDAGKPEKYPEGVVASYEPEGDLLLRLDRLEGRGAKRRRDIQCLQPRRG